MIRNALKILIAGGALFGFGTSNADVVTEWGWGIKAPNTSVVMLPRCQSVALIGDITTNPESPNFGRRFASCGGNNPAFIGWPIAWESDDFGKHGAFKVRGGWFHYSNWFDGGNYFRHLGDRHETHMDLAAFTITFNWTHWNRGRVRARTPRKSFSDE
jgi:hypothetical protein